MDIAILILALLSLVHFIYEGIIAPSFRMKLRNEMFELRDEIRHLHATNEKCSISAFNIAHGGINQYLNRLHGVTIEFMVRFKEANRSPEFRKDVNRRKKALDDCDSPELQSIIKRANSTIEKSFFTNSAMWALYLIPVALIAVIVVVIASDLMGVISKVNRSFFRVFATPESRTDSLMGGNMRLVA